MNSQFAVAVHILALVHQFPDASSSAEMAGSVGTNPVVIRTVSGLLRRAGLLRTRRGVAGAELTRPPTQITLLDVYRAVGQGSVFRLHEHPHPSCPVGANIQATLEAHFAQAQAALEAELARTTLADVTADLAQRAS
ncbi:Rrf2 family transcriptional regulator [Deinococcus multiflagellatus]|uniref:Rrf2 family transcriptional regulator n=1 Tax=Deinococcus multiflagellatus TaxID=1656887 RepID=A0ABW1ZFG2_9DEIO|nr:Rrf2 family transcriptional regulator [Deinococcus multiflagellatus]MBZ9711934.1 Rrf2 family transcriptional regulator [Deinococcus multiflagellatus]